jgi:hypothetical protein
LSFLDAHIQCGDSLVGVFDPEVLEKGIPDGAYKPLTGDDKKVCANLKKKNQLFAVKGQRDLFTQSAMVKVVPSASCFEDIKEDDLQGVRRKEQAYQAWRQDPAIQQELLRADAYTAAFFLAKQETTQDLVPVTENLDDLERGSLLSPVMASAVTRAAESFRFLHWHLAFPDAMKAGGFDCVLGNPPWERLKVPEKEFFAARSEIIYEASNKATREQLIEALSSHTASPTDTLLVQEFETAKREAAGSSEFVRSGGRFPLSATGELNTYALFAEHFLYLIGPQGRAGLIVPTGIATDNSTKAYFDEVSRKGKLVSLISFENESFIFKEVHHAFKFCVLTLRVGVAQNASTQYCFYIRHFPQLSEAQRFFTLTADEIALLNPNTRTCPVFRSQMDAEITKRIFARVPILVQDSAGKDGNPWGARFMRMFDMAKESKLFSENPSSEHVPLYEAKLIHQFDHRWATYLSDKSSRDVMPSEKTNPAFTGSPRYWVRRSDVKAKLGSQQWDRKWLIGWRDVCRNTDERTMIAGLIPATGVNHKFLLLLTNFDTAALCACLLGCFNSLIYDFAARQKVAGTSFSYFYIKQLPVIPPDWYDSSSIDFIDRRVLELTYTSHDLKPWAQDLDYEGLPFSFDPDRRALLRAELDAYYAHLYGITRDELRYILDPSDLMGPDYPSESFRVLKNNEIRQFGEYRTQRLVLEAWDRLFGG